MKKKEDEGKLLKEAITLGMAYAKKRGYGDLDKGTSAKEKVECIYRLLVQDHLITPLPKDKEDGPSIKHRLVIWVSRLKQADKTE